MILYFVGTKGDHEANSYRAVSDNLEEATAYADSKGLSVFQKEVDVRPRRKRRKKRHV